MSLMQDQPKVTSAPAAAAAAEPSPPLEYQTRERANAQLRAFKLPRMQELGLLVAIFLLGAILSIYGWYDASPGQPNTFLNFDNLIDGIATPMSYYAIMAIGVTIVIITSGIDISVGSMLALSALGSAAVLQQFDPHAPAWKVLPVAFAVPLGVGLLAGVLNGALVVGLRMHPF